MKSWGKLSALVFTAVVVICLVARAQLNNYTPTKASPQADSIVQITAEQQGLTLVAPENLPWGATYWLVLPGGCSPPMPCPPADLTLPIYAITDNQFLVDATGGQVAVKSRWLGMQQASSTMVQSALEAQAVGVVRLIAEVQGAAARQLQQSQTRTMGWDVPMPGDDGDPGPTTNYPNAGGPAAPIFTTNDLWLQISGITNNSATETRTSLTIHSPWNVTNGVYDLYSTTNPAPGMTWRWVARCTPGQIQLIATNFNEPHAFFILGLTNDTDGGGLTDAYEKLVSKTNPQNPLDDRLTPLVGIQVTDAVAVEEANPTNTAAFAITRLGGLMGQPLTVTFGLSGTATGGTDYSLSAGTLSGATYSVTVPAWQTNLAVTLTAINDALTDGTKTATLTLAGNSNWTNDLAHASATAWILEKYTKIYTTVADFNQGVRSGLDAVTNNDDGHLVFKTNLPAQFPFINVACSHRGTVVRINTTNGFVMGEYATAPEDIMSDGLNGDSGSSPSRTTVDEYGNVWVANRDDNNFSINGASQGSITRIGLIMGGTRYAKTGTNYVANPTGQYVSLADATYNTCIDRDGDGYIRTSQGLGDILPWSDGFGEGLDLAGGVSTAEDEAITEYTRVPSLGTRTIAVDKFNDIWVGGHNDSTRIHLKVNGLTGSVVPNSVFYPGAGGYGGVIDALGNLWSADSLGNVMWLVPPTNLPPTTADWQALPQPTYGYGIAVDPVHPYIWQTLNGAVFRWNTNGTPVRNLDGTVQMFLSGIGFNGSQGLAVDANGHVWVSHAKGTSTTFGHLDTNGFLIGEVSLQVYGLWSEYFANTNLNGLPLFTNMETGDLNFSWTNGWPDASVPTNQFSARWSGVVSPQTQGSHVFYVSAEAGAAFRLKVNGTTIIDHWTNRTPVAVELAGTNWLGTNIAYDVKLEYAHFTNGAAVKLSWLEPGMTNQTVIGADRYLKLSTGATGVSVDAAGKIWAACFDSNTALRIDPNAGLLVVTNGVTNHVGLVDMVVDLSDGSWYAAPYNLNASPYNYSDMTGFNERVVNPALTPLKGYWAVINDSGVAGEVWQTVSWTASLTNGSAVEVLVRANDDRLLLADQTFVSAPNGVTLTGVKGRFIETRLSMKRENATNQPVVYDLTLNGISSSFNGDAYVGYVSAVETTDAVFTPTDLVSAGPMSYQWFIQYPWMNPWDLTLLPGETNFSLVITNVDPWLNGGNGTYVSERVSDATGEEIWLGPAELYMQPLTNNISGSGTFGPAQRYPMTINVFGQPTNLTSVAVTLSGLSHGHSADLEILLVSPSGTNIMLMSHTGGTHGVTDATLIFKQSGFPLTTSEQIYSGTYIPSNYGNITNMPGAPVGYYSTNMDNDLTGTNPNGVWRLYIYDDHSGTVGVGQLHDSWQLNFFFQ